MNQRDQQSGLRRFNESTPLSIYTFSLALIWVQPRTVLINSNRSLCGRPHYERPERNCIEVERSTSIPEDHNHVSKDC